MATEQRKRAATYARDMSLDGPNQINLAGRERPPELRKLLREAARRPRPFDTVIVYNMRVLGRPEQAEETVRELASRGVNVETAEGNTPPVMRVDDQECGLAEFLAGTDQPAGEPADEDTEDVSRIMEILLADGTVHYWMYNMAACRMMEDLSSQDPGERKNISWPHQGPICVEYGTPIKLDPDESDRGVTSHMNGLVIIPEGGSTKIITVGNLGPELMAVVHRLDNASGRVTYDGAEDNGAPLEDNKMTPDEEDRTGGFYARLAAAMRNESEAPGTA